MVVDGMDTRLHDDADQINRLSGSLIEGLAGDDTSLDGGAVDRLERPMRAVAALEALQFDPFRGSTGGAVASADKVVISYVAVYVEDIGGIEGIVEDGSGADLGVAPQLAQH